MRPCPACRRHVPDGFTFCGYCGSPLASGAGSPTEERKVVTVLFCDLAGFTARSETADPEDVRATLRLFQERVRHEIVHFGGTIEKYIGDAVMAIFGAPSGHEDDPERAIRAALRIVDSIADLREMVGDTELLIRIGINTGEVVASLGAHPERGEGMIAGDVVNVAARLQAAAPVGAIVVGKHTWRVTRDIAVYEELPAARVKGKVDEIPVWRLLRMKPPAGELATAKAPFIGRDDDIAFLQRAFARAVRDRSVHLVTIVGEPGVGKTRLVSEFAARLRSEANPPHWRQGRCLPYGEGITFWALGEVFKEEAGVLESDGPEQVARKISATVHTLITDPSEHGWFVARLAPLCGAATSDSPPPTELLESFTAWRRFIEAAATEPLVVVFEDVHWADQRMLEFVEHLVEWAVGAPLLVICTARPELFERHAGWGGGLRNSSIVGLAPLNEADTQRLIDVLLHDAALAPEIREELIDRAGGNPLYAEQFVNMLRDQNVDRTPTDPLSVPVPETVAAVIAARLDTLSHDRKALLQAASVVGKVFWAEAVSTIQGVTVETIEEHLHELVRKELVRPIRTPSMSDTHEYSFWHGLVRDVAYSQIPRPQRAALHRAAARWIELVAPDRIGDHADILAHHYETALTLGRAAGLGDDLEEVEADCRRVFALAGDRAVPLDPSKAVTFYLRALDSMADEDQQRPFLLAKVGDAEHTAGRWRDATSYYEPAIEGFQKNGRILDAGFTLVRLASCYRNQGQTSHAHELTEEAVAMLEDAPPSPQLAFAYAGMAYLRGILSPAEGLAWAEKSLGLAERLEVDEAITMRAREMRGLARERMGDEEGLEDHEEALRIGLRLGAGLTTAVTYNNLADAVWAIRGPREGLEVCHAGLEFSKRRGIQGMIKWIQATSLDMLFDAGRWDDGLDVAHALIKREETEGPGLVGVTARFHRAQVFLGRGDVQAAATEHEPALARAREDGNPEFLAPGLSLGASISNALSDPHSAADLLAELLQAIPSTVRSVLIMLPEIVRASDHAGTLELAAELVEGIRPSFARDRHSVATARAIIAASRDPENAVMLFRSVARDWTLYGNVPERARAHLGAARCLVRLGRGAEATADVAEACTVIDELHAEALRSEANELVAATSVK